MPSFSIKLADFSYIGQMKIRLKLLRALNLDTEVKCASSTTHITDMHYFMNVYHDIIPNKNSSDWFFLRLTNEDPLKITLRSESWPSMKRTSSHSWSVREWFLRLHNKLLILCDLLRGYTTRYRIAWDAQLKACQRLFIPLKHSMIIRTPSHHNQSNF